MNHISLHVKLGMDVEDLFGKNKRCLSKQVLQQMQNSSTFLPQRLKLLRHSNEP